MPLITLCSDMSPSDYQLGAIRGVLLQCDPSFQVVDLAHEIPEFQTGTAAYFLRGAARYYPAETAHIMLVNIFEQTPVRWILARLGNQYVVCPDNGFISYLEGCALPPLEISIPPDQLFNTIEFMSFVGEILRALFSGTPWEKLGRPFLDYQQREPNKPIVGDNWIETRAIHVDHFENVVFNLTREEFEEARNNRSFTMLLRPASEITKISNHYSDVPKGEKLALFNAAGFLEIAINQGNAAGLLGLNRASDDLAPIMVRYMNKRMFYHTIKIFFQ